MLCFCRLMEGLHGDYAESLFACQRNRLLLLALRRSDHRRDSRHSTGTEEEPMVISDKTEEPTNIDLEDTSGCTVPRATRTQEVASCRAEEEVSEEDEDEGEDGDEDED